MSQTAERQDRITLGIVLMLGFAFIAPIMDSFAKLTPVEIPVGEILVFRFGIQAMILIPLAFALGWLHRPTGAEVRLHILRAAMIVMATALFFYAIRFMPIADAISIFFVEPLILTLLGGAFFGEPVGPRRIIACLVGLGGALLVIQPSFERLGWVATLPLGTAFSFAIYMLLTRRMAKRMHPVTLQGYTAIAALALIAPLTLMWPWPTQGFLGWQTPSAFAWFTLAGVGIIATCSHLCLSFSLSFAPASVIAPLQYFEIVAATVLGLLLFGDFPNALTFVGIGIIVASGLYVFVRERSQEVQTPAGPVPPA